MSATLPDIAPGIAALIGEARVATEPSTCAALAVDGIAPRCVVSPSTAEEIASTLRWAAEHDLGVIPCCNATKLAMGNIPERYDVALSLKEMTRVWHYEPSDLTITAEAGMELGDFQEFVGKQGLWLPLDPPGGARASLGGIAATNAAGPLRLSFGSPRDMILGMKIATADGKVLKAGGRVVKNVTGYDIGKLLIGSYGALGVIAEISLKLFPLPASRATYTLAAGTLGIARDLRRRILSSPLAPARFVLLDGAATSQGSKGPELWFEVHGSDRLIERAGREFGSYAAESGVPMRSVDTAEADAVWGRIRDIHPWALKIFPGALVLKATLPDSAVAELISRAEQDAAAEKAECGVVAQLGAGIIHFCILNGLAVEAQSGLIRRLRRATEALGGMLIIERCPLVIKEQFDAWGTPGSDFDLMKKMKGVWDAKGILSPRRGLGYM